MARIRILQRDRKEYARLVKNTRAKIYRTRDKYGIDLSGEIPIPDIDTFSTRKEFNEWKKEQARFTNRSTLDYQYVKNKHDVVITRKELLQVRQYTREAQKQARKIERKYEKLPFIVDGEVEGTVGQAMKKVARPSFAGAYVPEDFNFETVKNRAYFEKRLSVMRERSRDSYFDLRLVTFKDNYITSLEQNFNNIADPLIDIIDKIPDDMFFEIYLKNIEILDFNEHYTTPADDLRDYVAHIRGIIEGEVRDGSFDLKDF